MKPIKIVTFEPEVLRFFLENSEMHHRGGITYYHMPHYFSHREGSTYTVFDRKDVQLWERFFFVSYNGVNPEDGKTVLGHLAFSHQGYPSLLYITEVLIPQQSKCKITDVVISAPHEFTNQQDFDDFTVGRNMGDQLGDLIKQN